MRLIDADALKETIFEKIDSLEDLWDSAGVLNAINHTPTVEIKPIANITIDEEKMKEYVEQAKAETLAEYKIERKQGKWIDIGNTGSSNFCSVCKEFVLSTHLNFCSNCGAQMQRGNNNDTGKKE